MILAGDIGATKTVLAFYRIVSESLEQVNEETYKSKAFSGFEEILRRFIAILPPEPIAVLCLGVAGPIDNGRCKTTNLPWMLDERSLADAFGIKKVILLNDVEAAAYGILALRSDEIITLHGGTERKGNLAVLAAGTGLGEAALHWDGKGYQAIASEGGHCDFAPQDNRQIALLSYLQKKFDHVSYERILSGQGLLNLYQFLRDTGFSEEPPWLQTMLQSGDPSAKITEIGLRRGHILCSETLELFATIYGAEAGNLALKVMATGGVYLGGGIAPQIIEKLKDGSFMRGFSNKGRYADFMRQIPVKVASNNRASLIGAAHHAARI